MVVEPVMVSALLLTIEPPLIVTTSGLDTVAATASEPPEMVSTAVLLTVNFEATRLPELIVGVPKVMRTISAAVGIPEGDQLPAVAQSELVLPFHV